MAFTFIGSAVAVANASGTTIDCGSTLNVAAGDTLICWTANEDVAATSLAVSDGGSNSFTMEAQTSNGGSYGAMGVLLSASANATATFTMSHASSVPYRILIVLQFRPTSAASVDQKNIGTGSSATPTSGTITTTGNDVIVVGGHKVYTSGTGTNHQIGGVAADGAVDGSIYVSAWYRILSAPASDIAATVTTNSAAWVCNIFAVKASATGQFARPASDVMASGILRFDTTGHKFVC